MKFQKYVTGKRMSMEEIREAIGQPVYTMEDFSVASPLEKQKDKLQIYEDFGQGFSEENSFFLEEKEFEIVIAEGRKMLRIDPCSDYCIVLLKELRWNGAEIPLKSKLLTMNGFKVGDGTYAFATQDPNITLQVAGLEQKEDNVLKVSMQVTRMPIETISHMQKRGLF